MKEFRFFRPGYIAVTIAVLMAAYHLLSTQRLLEPFEDFKNTHLGLALVLVFLGSAEAAKKRWTVGLAAILASLAVASSAYKKVLADELVIRAGFPTTLDCVVGWILVVLILEGCRRAYNSLILPVIAILGIAYLFLCSHMPGTLRGPELAADTIVNYLATSHGDTGLYGPILGISAKFIFLFVLFGGLMQASGAPRFFIQVARLLSARLAGGSIMGAVFSSAMVGMITGAPAANVAITGSFTIPAMKAAGVKPEVAGAFEATASTGGSVMPPVMGGTAFLMAGLVGIPYIHVCAMAVIPALLYFFTMGIQAQIVGLKSGLRRQEVEVNYRDLWLGLPLFFIPVGAITVVLLIGKSAAYAAFWGIIASLAITVVMTPLIKEDRPTLRKMIQGCLQGARSGARISVALACIGAVQAALTLTGLGIKIPATVAWLSGGYLFVALLITIAGAVVLGMGLPGPAVYVLVVLTAAPALVDLGLSKELAHLFVLFWGTFAAITPPVAIASLVGAQIAGGAFFPTALYAVRIGVAAYLLPFLFVWNPILTMRSSTILSGVLSLLAVVLGLIASAAAMQNHGLSRLGAKGTALCVAIALALFGFVINQHYYLFVTGVSLFIILALWQFSRKKMRTEHPVV